MLLCWNVEGVHGKRKVGNPSCSRMSEALFFQILNAVYFLNFFAGQ